MAIISFPKMRVITQVEFFQHAIISVFHLTKPVHLVLDGKSHWMLLYARANPTPRFTTGFESKWDADGTRPYLSTPLHKFTHVFQAARAARGCACKWSRWTSLLRSSRVNFHSKGLAMVS